MKIRMRNTIQFDEQLEVIDQLYDVELREKGDFSYLLFYNEEQEKVVIKFSRRRARHDALLKSQDYHAFSEGFR